MSSVAQKLRACRGELFGIGSLPLLPVEDFEEYARVCGQVVGVADELALRPSADPTPEATVEALFDIALDLRTAGDDLTAVDLLGRAAAHAEARGLERLASGAHNQAGITLYYLGELTAALVEFDRSLALLGDDDYGQVRSLLIRMNRGNVVHDLGDHAAAEAVFRELRDAASHGVRRMFAEHAPFGVDRFLGMLAHNLCTNRIDWAREEREATRPFDRHVAVARGYLAEALALPLAPTERVQAHMNDATITLLTGDAERAERRLLELAHACASERELMVLLPELYRYAAEASADQGQTKRAIINCYRALESSLTVADRLQERRVVETFVAVLRVSSSVLFEPGASPSHKAERIESEALPLVERLIDFLERKDWYTGHSHSKAVQTISMRMAHALVERDDAEGRAARRAVELHTLGLAAALHDIGKLAVPWSVLNKLIALTSRDRAILRRHPEAGYRILVEVGLPEIGAVVLEHHEAPDGSGYPYGKCDSSLMGAIIAVADAFEAMTTVNRRYRTPKSKAEALREVRELAGRQFDARVAAALERVIGGA